MNSKNYRKNLTFREDGSTNYGQYSQFPVYFSLFLKYKVLLHSEYVILSYIFLKLNSTYKFSGQFSLRHLESECSMNQRTVMRCLRKLEKIGFISRHRDGYGPGYGETFTFNTKRFSASILSLKWHDDNNLNIENKKQPQYEIFCKYGTTASQSAADEKAKSATAGQNAAVNDTDTAVSDKNTAVSDTDTANTILTIYTYILTLYGTRELDATHMESIRLDCEKLVASHYTVKHVECFVRQRANKVGGIDFIHSIKSWYAVVSSFLTPRNYDILISKLSSELKTASIRKDQIQQQISEQNQRDYEKFVERVHNSELEPWILEAINPLMNDSQDSDINTQKPSGF